jgi:hypothetical protein
LKTSARNLRAPSRRNKFFAPARLNTRAKLGIESLETRAVFNVDNGLNEVHVVFAPETPAATVQAYEDLAHQDGLDAFSFGDADRWSRTVTDGSSLTQGTPTTIRWSIVPDGTPISGYNGEPAAPSNLRSFFAGIYGSNASSSLAQDQPWFDEVKSSFDRWSAVSGVNYVYEPADDGAALGSTYAGVMNVRGDVRISGHYIDGPSNILAYNFYPTVGDMVIDTGDSFYYTTTNNSLRLRNTMAHELGHGLGLGHVNPVNGTKLMEPSLTLSFDGPQADDILAVNRGYGDRLEKNGGNNTAATAYSLGSGSTFSLDTLSVDDDSDVDWFQFTVGAGAALSVNLAPTGSTYTSNGTTFNSLAQSNLALAVYGSGGSTLLASANAGAAGVAESLSNFNLPGSGTYYVRVTGSANAAQMYRLSGTISNVVVTNAPEINVLDGATTIADNSGAVSFGSVSVGGFGSKTFTIQNLGDANLTLGTPTVPAGFILTQAPATSTVAPGASTTFIVALDTSIAGTFSGAVSFANNDADENPYNFSLSGTVAISAPEISVLDGTTELVDGVSTLNFGSVLIGGTATKTITVRNVGTADLTVSNLVLPTAYSLVAVPPSGTIAPGDSITLTLALNTTTAGTFSGGMTLVNNDSDEGSFNFNVTGTVTTSVPVSAPEISILDGTTELVDGSSVVNFGSAAVGGTLSKTFTIRNLGDADLLLTQIVLPNAYALSAGPGVTTLAPGESTTITLSLTATAGTFTGGVALANNDANEGTFNFTVTGTVTSAPTTPLTLFSDNFNRANNSSLGANWQERSGNFSISNQSLVNSTSGTSVALVNNQTADDVVLTASVNLSSTSSTRDAGLVARHNGLASGSQYYAGLAYRSGRYYSEIWESTNGSWTRLSQVQVSSNGTASLKFEVIGSSLKLYVNGVLRNSVTDTSLTSGRFGVSAVGTGARIDNFVATDPAAPVTAPVTTTAKSAAPVNNAASAAAAAQAQHAQWLAAVDKLLAQWFNGDKE